MDENFATPTAGPRGPRIGIAAAGTLGALGIATALVVGAGTAGAATSTASGGTVGQSAPAVAFGHGSGWPDRSSGSSTGATAGDAAAGPTTTATAAEQIGVVDITTVLGYQGGRAAGTGMVLSSGGEILTNNHVIDGATSITVTLVGTGASYGATVVGTDPSDDVAVLQLRGASGLRSAHFSSQGAYLGEAVTGVGNAGGTGGAPSAAPGTVTALDQTITASDGPGKTEQLHGLIETDAALQPGDSGGPLYDSASERVIGMDTAASSGGTPAGYAIPISTALSIARHLEAGVQNATYHQGYPAFLGVSVDQSGSGGAAVADVVPGGPAQQAGLTGGDVITAVDGTTIGAASDLSAALATHSPGDTVPVTWTDAAGATHTAQVTLASGPAD